MNGREEMGESVHISGIERERNQLAEKSRAHAQTQTQAHRQFRVFRKMMKYSFAFDLCATQEKVIPDACADKLSTRQ